MRFDDWRKVSPSLRARQIKTIAVISLFVGWWICMLLSVYWASNPDRIVRGLLFFALANVLSGLAFWIGEV